jgi:predicted acyl esterase
MSMKIQWDVPIVVDDGLTLSADVFGPDDDEPHPVLLSYGPYAKGLSFQEGYPSAWELMVEAFPEIEEGSSGRYQSWEVVDPERWVPWGYVCVRVDSRGAGRSPGRVDPYSPRETHDLAQCIEWAALQPWSTGKIGLAGISYYAINQWQVAAQAPPHLAAICPWEGCNQFYREASYHGGINSAFLGNWFEVQVESVQYGLGSRGATNPNNGVQVCGDEDLDDDELRRNRVDLRSEILAHPFDDEWHAGRSADLSKVTVPLLSAGNWGGQGLHLRGNVEGFVNAASSQKWLEIHGREHWTEFYTDYGTQLQRRFFDHFLKGDDNGWLDEPRIHLRLRTVSGDYVDRFENEWPIARTNWTRLYLDADHDALGDEPPSTPAQVSYGSAGDGVTFLYPAFDEDTELTGPMSAKLYISSSTDDADLFLVVRVFDAAGEEVLVQGAIDPQAPISLGWLRASHRQLVPGSPDYEPAHDHTSSDPLVPGDVYELDVEIWPSNLLIPAGYRIGLTVQGKDYDHGRDGAGLKHFRNEFRGVGPFIHNDPKARPDHITSAEVTIYTGPEHPSSVLFPFIPPQTQPTIAPQTHPTLPPQTQPTGTAT